jgi:hypothetical protein
VAAVAALWMCRTCGHGVLAFRRSDLVCLVKGGGVRVGGCACMRVCDVSNGKEVMCVVVKTWKIAWDDPAQLVG